MQEEAWMTKPKKNKLTIFLIKEEVEELDAIVDPGRTDLQRIEFDEFGTLFIRKSVDRSPEWVEGFFGGRLDECEWFGSSVSAALIVPVEVDEAVVRLFALTFGYGRAWLEDDVIERRFGLKCVLNSVKHDSLRQIKKTLISGNARKSSEQMPRRSTISDFSLDYEQDLLEGVSATGEKGNVLEGTVSGADSLSVSAPINLNGISDYLKKVYKAYRLETYKKRFSWIDHVSLVKDKDLIARLEIAAVGSLNAGDEAVWFSIPEVIEWENVAGFRYIPKGYTFNDILTCDLLETVNNGLCEFKQLKDKKVYAISSVDDEIVKSWSASRCLYGELQIGSNQYCVTDGLWYQIDKAYADEIQQDYEATTIASIVLPDYRKDCGGEGAYNEAFADSSESLLLMDQKNVLFGGGGDRIELCDVLSNNGQFIHVKRYGGSSVMSHLFNQGLVSMDLIKTEPRFVAKANQKIAELDSSGKFFIEKDWAQEVVFGIVTKHDVELPRVPFFSKVAFHHVKKRLISMDIKVSIGAIHEVT